jgi:hypothetical protein
LPEGGKEGEVTGGVKRLFTFGEGEDMCFYLHRAAPEK